MLVVLALVLGVVLARTPSRSPALTLRAATARVAAGLRLARSQAIATDRPVTVVADPASHSLRFGTAPYALPDGVMLSTADDRAATIVFAANGSSTGGVLRLAAGKLLQKVTVDWLTGRVEIGDATQAQ